MLQYSDTHHVASFVGFFPASHPQVSISVIVDDADADAQGASPTAGSRCAVFKRIGERLIKYLDIRPTIDNNDAKQAFAAGGLQ